MKTQQKIEEIINEAVTEKTFSLEIIAKIQDLKEEFNALTRQSEIDLENAKESRKQIENLTIKLSEKSTLLSAYELREEELTTWEKERAVKDVELKFQTSRANEIKELFGIVFRNPIVRETVYRNTAGNSNNNWNPENETTEKTTSLE